MSKNPASQFYWGDWRRDPGIRACDFETRGIWFEMLCIMWESENQGFFVLNGIAPDDVTASRMIGCTTEKYLAAVTELEAYHVMSRDSHGIIYNRRMVKEAKIRKDWSVRQARHRKNVTNRSLKNHTNVTPLSSSSSSDLNNNKEITNDVTPPKYYKNELNNFVCSLCQKSFIQWKNLQNHFKDHK